MTVGTKQSDTGYPSYDSVAQLKTIDLQVGNSVTTESYYAWGTSADPRGGATYNILTAADFTTLTGVGTANGLGDHVLDNGNVAMVNRKDTIDTRQWGAKGDGTQDDSAIIAAALTAAATNGGIVSVYATNYTNIGSTTLTITNGVILDLNWSEARPSGNTDMFVVQFGGQLRNCRANVEGLTYTSTICAYVPTSNAQGQRTIPWFDGLICKLDSGTGTAVKYHGLEYYIQLTTANNLSVANGLNGVLMVGGDESLEYVNGNILTNISLHDTTNLFNLDAQSDGNIFSGISIENNSSVTITCAGNKNVFHGIGWDQVSVVVSGNGNFFDINTTTAYSVDITDTGVDNRASGNSSFIQNHRSISQRQDWRMDRYGNGQMEFRDLMLGGYDSKWTKTVVGAGAVNYAANDFGSEAGFIQFKSYVELTTASGVVNDSAKLDFNGNGFVRTTNRPVVHFSNMANSNDARCIWQVGLWKDSSNYIYLTQDFGLYSDDDIRLVTSSGGTATTVSMVTAASGRITYATIDVVSSSKVVAYLGQENSTGSGNGSRPTLGVSSLIDQGLTATSTTNIPANTVNLEPYVYLKQGNSNAAWMRLFDYQLLCGMKSAR